MSGAATVQTDPQGAETGQPGGAATQSAIAIVRLKRTLQGSLAFRQIEWPGSSFTFEARNVERQRVKRLGEIACSW